VKLFEVIYLVIRFTKENLIKDIAKQTKSNISDVKEIYNALENVIFDILSSVDESQDVNIRLFEGISLDGIYVPEKEKRNNLTGKVSFVESKIKPKFYITRSYCEKLNNQ
jgi:nucleoid DNA-binding protein